MSRLAENGREKLMLVMPIPELMQQEEQLSDDPLMDLMNEFSAFDSEESSSPIVVVAPPVVHTGLKEDQAWVALGRQLDGLRDGLQRLHYYLSDVDDNLRR